MVQYWILKWTEAQTSCSVLRFVAWPHAIDWEIEKCRYVTERPQWYPRIIWGASLDGASYVLSIPLQLWKQIEVLHLFRCSTHTHTPPSGDKSWGPDCEVKMRMKREMKMRWKWRWNESYLTGTRDGERKKGEEEPRENTNTNTPCPERANPEKAREKKSGGRRKNTKTGGGGGRRKRLNQPKPQRKQDLPKHARNRTYLERGARMK